MNYVDAVVVAVPKRKLAAYRSLARQTRRVRSALHSRPARTPIRKGEFP